MRTRHDSADEGRRQLTILTVAICSRGQTKLNMLDPCEVWGNWQGLALSGPVTHCQST